MDCPALPRQDQCSSPGSVVSNQILIPILLLNDGKIQLDSRREGGITQEEVCRRVMLQLKLKLVNSKLTSSEKFCVEWVCGQPSALLPGKRDFVFLLKKLAHLSLPAFCESCGSPDVSLVWDGRRPGLVEVSTSALLLFFLHSFLFLELLHFSVKNYVDLGLGSLSQDCNSVSWPLDVEAFLLLFLCPPSCSFSLTQCVFNQLPRHETGKANKVTKQNSKAPLVKPVFGTDGWHRSVMGT